MIKSRNNLSKCNEKTKSSVLMSSFSELFSHLLIYSSTHFEFIVHHSSFKTYFIKIKIAPIAVTTNKNCRKNFSVK